MADHVLETKILLRYGTYNQWMNSDVILKAGEAAIAIFPDPNNSNNPPKAVGIKIGNGRAYFEELPWILALSADVYNWAKQSTKPTYNAIEIEGLQSFVEQYAGGGGSSGISGSAYRLVYDTSTNKYIFQYYDDTLNEWVDTTSNIDLSSILKRINDLERFANGELGNLGNIQDPLMAFIYDGIVTYLNRLDVADEPVEGLFVTSVSEENGKISILRRGLTAADIVSGTLKTSLGGTGLTYVESDELLSGSNNGNITTKTISSNLSLANNNDIPTAGAVISYVTNATAGLTGAMHFIGEATVVINPNSGVNPNISGYDFSKVLAGDVILSGTKEFVWDGSSWLLLGDEGSYAVKGSIKDTDIAADAEISQSKIANLDSTFNSKVDKVDGKTLTSNDFTDELKEKLENIENEALKNTIEHILINGTEFLPTTVDLVEKSVNLIINEFDAASQLKLSTIETGAEVNKIEKIIYDGTEMVPNENKVVTITSDPHKEHENKIEQIFINGTEWAPNQNKLVKITIDLAALNLNVLEGATIPNNLGGRDEVTLSSKKLELERIAVTGDVKDLLQTSDTYIILNCGSSTEVI